MSATISIVTDDPALEALLGILIAKAIDGAGFTTVMSKTVMLKNDTTTPFNRITPVYAQLSPEAPVVKLIKDTQLGSLKRMPPELTPIHWMIPEPTLDFIGAIESHNPNILEKPILLSCHQDTSKLYEAKAEHFLLNGTLNNFG